MGIGNLLPGRIFSLPKHLVHSPREKEKVSECVCEKEREKNSESKRASFEIKQNKNSRLFSESRLEISWSDVPPPFHLFMVMVPQFCVSSH